MQARRTEAQCPWEPAPEVYAVADTATCKPPIQVDFSLGLYAMIGVMLISGICMWEAVEILARWGFRLLGKMRRNHVKREVRRHLQRLTREASQSRSRDTAAGPIPLAEQVPGSGPQSRTDPMPKATGQIASAASSSTTPCERVSNPFLPQRVSNPVLMPRVSSHARTSNPVRSTASQGTRRRVAQAVQDSGNATLSLMPVRILRFFGDFHVSNQDNILVTRREGQHFFSRRWFSDRFAWRGS